MANKICWRILEGPEAGTMFGIRCVPEQPGDRLHNQALPSLFTSARTNTNSLYWVCQVSV